MAKRMLIDATHPEETRVVILSGSRLDEFDFETSTKKQIKGNIYLAKVTRVEPSLQAAFVEYGGNRHGFLAFSEIHPDYYRIPVADREALLAEHAAAAADDDEDMDEEPRRRGRRQRRGRGGPPHAAAAENGGEPADADYADHQRTDPELTEREPDGGGASDGDARADGAHHQAAATPGDEATRPDGDERVPPAMAATDGHVVPTLRSEPMTASYADEPPADAAYESSSYEERAGEAGSVEVVDEVRTEGEAPAPATQELEAPPEPTAEEEAGREEAAASIETLGGDELEDVRRRRPRSTRQYKIQEVVKRRQIMLVQVTKEERGNKGAALTTYLSLAGRYCVLMPNSGRGGGVSRKIVNPVDRRRLKSLIEEMQLPEGMSVIVRTAGSERSRAEIKRDLEYLLRLWDEIRELTMQSTAPALVYEEGKLIKRAIRDLYSRDIEEILVEGEDAYREAKDFMRMLMPSHAKRVQPYRDPGVPLFNRFQIDQQIDAIHSPVVQLKSGGYIVINPTEALVAIDVNSGRSTRERNIEETAYRTNIEAADEIARQLRLRDLAGLIVIDFIDMEEPRNQHAVERRLKEAMKSDRARIQIGRISPFGLLELSRQRLRPSLVETSTQPCPHCGGTGHIRSTESTALHVLRAIEEEGLRRRSAEIRVTVPTSVALYILNQKRAALTEIERRYAFLVLIDRDDALIPPDYRLERLRVRALEEAPPLPLPLPARPEDEDLDTVEEEDVEEREDEAEAEPARAAQQAASDRAEAGTDEDGRRRRRRRRRRDDRPMNGGDAHAPVAEAAAGPVAEAEMPEGEAAEGEEREGEEADAAAPGPGRDEDEQGRRRRRRGRRGGRRRGRREDEGTEAGNGHAPEGAPLAAGPEDNAPEHRPAETRPAEPRIREPRPVPLPLGYPIGVAPHDAVAALFEALEADQERAAAAPRGRTEPPAPAAPEPVAAEAVREVRHAEDRAEPAAEPVAAETPLESTLEEPVSLEAPAAPPPASVEPVLPQEPRQPESAAAAPEPAPPASPDGAAAPAAPTPEAPAMEPAAAPPATPVPEQPPRPARKGWWQRMTETG